MKKTLNLFCTFMLVVGAVSQEEKARDYVPDSQTAIAIAEAVLIPVYGRKTVEGERPYTAVLKGDTWTVSGTVCPHGSPSGLICDGGAATVELSNHDAHIISLVHYK